MFRNLFNGRYVHYCKNKFKEEEEEKKKRNREDGFSI